MYVLSKDNKVPIYCVGIGIDISHFKKDDFINHTIESIDSTGQHIKLLEEQDYNTNQEVQFTPRETLIIHYLLEGCSSKQISEKLFISINTVNNHRQNILKKHNCSNIAQLMTFILKTNLR